VRDRNDVDPKGDSPEQAIAQPNDRSHGKPDPVCSLFGGRLGHSQKIIEI